MKEEVSAGIILFNDVDKRKFLLLNYPSKHWDFVKGKMEKSETPHETAIRETKEETGLDEVTRDYKNHFLNIAIAYGGQNELVDAVKKIGIKIKTGELDAEEINKEVIESNLYTSHLPQSSPDMILRTSGEKRMSGFLLWQSAYSELVFLDIFWPEFRKIDLMRAIRTFQKRKRRVGK